MLLYCWKRFSSIKTGNKCEKGTLSLDYLQTQHTDFLGKLNCHDCWKLCWLIWITESMCTWTSLNHEFLRWSVARNQNTVATMSVAREGNGNATPNSEVFRLINYLKHKPKKHQCKSTKLPQRTHPTSAFSRIETCIWPFVIINDRRFWSNAFRSCFGAPACCIPT